MHGIAQRLLAVDAFDASFGRENHLFGVRTRPSGNADHVEVFALDHFPVVGIGSLGTIAVADAFGLLLDWVADGDQLHALAGDDCRRVRIRQKKLGIGAAFDFVVNGGTHAPAADESNSVGSGHFALLFAQS